MNFEEFNKLINGKKEEKEMNETTKLIKEMAESGELEEFLKYMVDRKIEEFRKSYNEIDKMLYREYKDAVNHGIRLIGFFEQIDTQSQIQMIYSLAKGYVNELYNKGNLELSLVDKDNIEIMFNVVKEHSNDGFLEATLYSLLNPGA